jgi:SnoaL-like polyketide cyclase
MGLFLRPRRQLLRLAAGAATAGNAYHAGRRRAELAADLRGRAGAFSDIDIVLDPVEAVGDKLIAEWRVAATHTGVLTLDDDLAVEPTGRRLELRGVVIAEFEGDRIRSLRQYWNEVELIDGLGLLPV